jgi:pilus assembly protein Flp/PilA
MYDKMLNLWVRFKHDDEGVTLVEYGIALTLAVIVGTTALGLLGAAVSGKMDDATALLP